VTNLTSNTDLENVEDFENIVVKKSGSSLIRLKDIARVELGAENYDDVVAFNGNAATFMGIWALPNANSLDVVKDIRRVLPQLRDALPAGIKLDVPYDSTEYIDSALKEVLKTFAETIAIVIVVIFFFIGSFRSVLVPVVAIPLSLLGGAALMYAFGFSLNLLTLLAIVLAVGLVVDDAIVVLESVEQHVHKGLSPFEAALQSARELVGPIIAMTITLAAVYTPIAFQGGLTGVLFKEFALTLAGAVAISGFVALTLSPMMASKLVRPSESARGLKPKIEHFFQALQARYQRWLERAVRWRGTVLGFSAVLILIVPALYMFSMHELAPREDQGILFGIVQAAPNSTVDQTLRYAKEVQGVFESFPEYANSFQITGPSFGFSGLIAKPYSDRDRTTIEMEEDAWAKTGQVAGVRLIVFTPPPLPGGADFPIEFVITSTADAQELYGYAKQLVGAAFASGMFMFADSDLQFDMPASEITLDRNKIADAGLDLQQIGDDLSLLTGGNFVNRFSIAGRSYKVIPQLARAYRLNPEQLLSTYVSGPNDSLIPLSSIAYLREHVQPRELKRFQQLNSVTIQGAIPPGVTIDAALSALEEAAAKILPADYEIDYAGESRQLRKEGGGLAASLLGALVMIYLVLAAQFESFRDPFIILAGSVPLALAGALTFAFLGFTSMNIYSQVGLVTLVGLVAKNAILIVEFANVLQEQGIARTQAVIQAAASRLRPILMTSVATVVGHFPLILAIGAGAGARNSIGIVLVSGMIIGTVFTLFVVPVIYSVFGRNYALSHKGAAA
jgi:multidrug efflux pump